MCFNQGLTYETNKEIPLLGKVVDIDVSSAQTEHAGGKTNDLNLSISKAFFDDRLRITLGSTFTDNPEINQTSGLLNNFTAD